VLARRSFSGINAFDRAAGVREDLVVPVVPESSRG
jgi:hypothetical protein